MSLTDFLFYLFSTITVGAGVMVITARNPVRAALFLVLTFISCSGLWLLLQAEFLAMILVLVYVGAVMVLFLFVVMMLDINTAMLKEGFTRYLPIGIVIAALVIAELSWVLFNSFANNEMPLRAADYSNIKQLGMVLYTHYAFAFECAALLLLVAMVAAVSMTFRGRQNRRGQDVAKQVCVRKEDRIKIVNMDT